MTAPAPAEACGGCFVPPTESTVVAGHRMALAISTTQTVLWDQIQYSGDPKDFAWVLPVREGTRIEAAKAAWFEVLESGSAQVVQGLFANCGESFSPSLGCGASADLAGAEDGSANGGGVTVTHRGTVGPYETVTLSATKKGALNEWLVKNNYNVDAATQPVIDAYVAEGFDFIALRLQPGKGVREMTPVRVVSQGASPVLPLRMVAAGTGAQVGIVLFVIAEGRYEAKNFANVTFDQNLLAWDFLTRESNFAEVRKGTLAKEGGRGFMTAFAGREALFDRGRIADPNNFSSVDMATAYFTQALANGEATGCGGVPQTLAERSWPSQARVVSCPEGACEPSSDTISAAEFTCGDVDDLAVALTGMRLSDVWVTRLEADLPRAALAADLELQAAKQESVSNLLVPQVHVNEEDFCESVALPPPRARGDEGSARTALVLGVLGLCASALAMRTLRRTRGLTPA